ncbi:MAG: 50S ribosomal protein L30 [Bacteroidetes bacterium ADurb.Bin408]|nr:MAG: 50S ribosomal protein L30 [Bacteroidetes bacterium ADurb.Bin408]
MEKIKIRQIKSGIGQTLRQKRTLEALGFKRMYQVIEVTKNPQIEGMIKKVSHLIEVVE